MSVAELAPRGGEFERTPPHDLAAEQCVLGGMLMSKDAISDVMEVISPPDHYRPAHQLVHEAILELYGRGEPADPVTVSDLLAKRGELARVGGGAYLHTLLASVPTAANAGYYARIVRERAILRRLVEAGTRIVQLGYTGDGDADELVDRAEAEIYGVTERRVAEDFLPLSEIMPGALDEIEAIGSRGGVMTGVPTGFSSLDSLTNGLHPGQMIVIAARPAIGKALALDTPLPTPTGWTTMGQVTVGEQLLGADGRPVTVVAATEVMHGRPCYEVEFSDGEVIVADARHQWLTWTRRARKAYDHYRDPDSPAYPDDWPTWVSSSESCFKYGPGERDQIRQLRAMGMSAAQVGRVLGRTPEAVQQQWLRPEEGATQDVRVAPRTTEEIAATLRVRGEKNHAIPVTKALDLPDAKLPLDPYVLGYLLGDGDSTGSGRVACHPRDRAWLVEEFRTLGHDVGADSYDPGHFGVRGIRQTWRSMGLAGAKHVPPAYLRSSFFQRLALVQGLVDSDGSVNGHGAYQFCNVNKRLVDDFIELAVSLGCVTQVHRRQRTRAGRSCQDAWEVTVSTELPLTRLPRKALRARREWKRDQVSHYIVDVRPVPSRPVRCVQVDSADHLYLAGRSMIPTHNSTLALDLARAAAVKHGQATVMFSLEMSRNEITMRLLSAESRVALHHMRTGQLGEDDWTRLARRMSEVVDAPLFIDDSPNMSMMEIRAKCRRLKQRHSLRLVIIDYLQLMSSPRRVENRQQEVSEMSRSLKLLAKELDVPVVAVSQLNRGPEQRNDKRPLLSDLRESGCMPASTRLLRADTGTEVTLGELLLSQEQPQVLSLDDRWRLVSRKLTRTFPSGIKPVFRIRLASGRYVDATANHKFRTVTGWSRLDGLTAGAFIAVPRQTPTPLAVNRHSEDELILLAHLLGDGSMGPGVKYATADPANKLIVEQTSERLFGIKVVGDRIKKTWQLWLPSPYRVSTKRHHPVRNWLEPLGLWCSRSDTKFVPDFIYSLPGDQIALFLRHLWATDGSITMGRNNRGAIVKIYYASTSRELAEGVRNVLLRLGIRSSISPARKAAYKDSWHVRIQGSLDQIRFLTNVGCHGERGEIIPKALEVLATIKPNPNVDLVPWPVAHKVKEALSAAGLTHRALAAQLGERYCGSYLLGHEKRPRRFARGRLNRIAEITGSKELADIATSDVYWDEVKEIVPMGLMPVFDATVEDTHNFIANGIIAHNSIEQDSDVVILLHREDAYERESPRAGEADLIVAKHRNGPTAVVTVAFQGHYSRFVDMAPG